MKGTDLKTLVCLVRITQLEEFLIKSTDSLTFQALNALNVKRRVILSGTPIQVSIPAFSSGRNLLTNLTQNDLSEYFSLLNFANPNYLGSKGDFRKNFENAIIRGRDADAADEVKAHCEAKLKELGALVTPFIIRRTNDLLSKYRKKDFFTRSCPDNSF